MHYDRAQQDDNIKTTLSQPALKFSSQKWLPSGNVVSAGSQALAMSASFTGG
jgi:hypothetical protein